MTESEGTTSGEFEAFALGLGSVLWKRKRPPIIFLVMAIILVGGACFLIKHPHIDPVGFASFCVGGVIMIGASVLSHFLDKGFLQKQNCPCCKGKLRAYTGDQSEWFVECRSCGMKASTGYTGYAED